jgi:RimJ/RimL family protein N-acetyltransferase
VRNEWVKGEWTDELIYAVLAEEWAASRLGAG